MERNVKRIMLNLILFACILRITYSEKLHPRNLEFVPSEFKVTPEKGYQNMKYQVQVAVTHPPGTLTCKYILKDPITKKEINEKVFISNYYLSTSQPFIIPFTIGTISLPNMPPFYNIKYECSYFCVNRVTHTISQESYLIIDPRISNDYFLPYETKTNYVNDNTPIIMSYITKTPEEQTKDLAEKLSNLLTPKAETEFYLQQSILLSNLFSVTNCTTYLNSTDDCNNNLKTSQGKIFDKLEEVLNCQNLQEKIFNTSKPEKVLTLSSLSVLYQTENPQVFQNNTLAIQTQISECFTNKGADFLNRLYTLLPDNPKLFDDVSSDYLNSLIYSSSNNIEILKNFIYKNVTTPKNSSLIIDDNTLGSKSLAEENSLLLVKNNYTTFPDKVTTDNLVFYSKTYSKKKAGRLLQEGPGEYEKINVNNNKTNVIISMPMDYLLDHYLLENVKVGVILYNQYPLLQVNSKNYSESVVSIKLYDENNQNQIARDLAYPINIIFKKPSPDFSVCLHYDPKNFTWSDQNCVAKNLTDGYLMCSCNHLTDFTIANFNPVYIYEDIKHILNDTNWMTDFEEFKYLNIKNATVIYIYSFLTLLFAIGLFFALKYDLYVSNDNFFIGRSDQEKPSLINRFCSKTIFVNEVISIKTKTEQKLVPEKKKRVKEYLQENVDNEIVVDEMKRRKTIRIKNNCEPNSNENLINSEKTTNLNRRLTVMSQKAKIDDDLEMDYEVLVDTYQKREIKTFKNNLYTSYQISSNGSQVSNFEVVSEGTDYEKPLNDNDPESDIEKIGDDKNSQVAYQNLAQTVEIEKIELKNEWIHKILALLQIVQQYNLYTALVMNGEYKLIKTDNLTLIFFNITTSFAVCGLFSPQNSITGSHTQASDGYNYYNRSFAVSIIVLIIVHIPTKIMTLFLNKKIIYKGEKADR